MRPDGALLVPLKLYKFFMNTYMKERVSYTVRML